MFEQLGTNSTASNILAQEHNLCYYHSVLVEFLNDSIPAAILLQKMIYWGSKQENHFYKFKEPCNHRLYRPGDSWSEELGFSRRNFDSAIKIIGSKYNPAKDEKIPDAYVLYYTDIQRLTWYMINWNKVNILLEKAFVRKVRNALYIKSETYNRKSANRTLVYNDTIKTSNKDSNITTIIPDITIPVTETKIADADFVEVLPDKIPDSVTNEKITLLKHYGISDTEAQKIADKFSTDFIKVKLRLIENKFIQGKISNLQGYIIHVFQSEKEDLSEFEKNINTKKEMSAQKRKQEELKKERQRQIEEEENKEFERKTDKLLAEASLNDYKNFKKWLEKESSLVYGKYIREGTSSYMVEMFLRKFLFDTYYGHADNQETKDNKL
ncbi:MAG: hypothetical protein KA886_03610 [Candidatus Cloacimonetes bacterium]|nr:hypothetical protein [Candidatus Cloacimonadota bacterium]